MSNNPYEAPPPVMDGGGGGVPHHIVAKVAAPAIGLLVVGILYIAFALFNVAYLAIAGAEVNATQREQLEEMVQKGGNEAQVAEIMLKVMEVTQGPLAIVSNLIAVVIGGITIAGALKMKKLKSYGLALTSAILPMIPCFSCCCVAGLPVGIWALIVLMNKDVKRSFS